jgi:type I restriction enzyme M protein
LDIVKTLTEFKDNEYAKVFEKEFFYFNKQALMLTNLDVNGKSFEDELPPKKKSLKLTPLKIVQDEITVDEFSYNDIGKLDEIKETIKAFDYKESDLRVYMDEDVYYFYDSDRETLIKQSQEKQEELGCDKIVIKSSHKKATKTKEANITITVELRADYSKDYEIIPYSSDEELNQKNIDDFMAKYISKPFELLDNVVGVEINFNKIFYKPQKLRPLDTILAELSETNSELVEMESELGL